MDILNTVSLECNSQIKINFDGGDLSSDAGLLLFKEFLFKIGAVKLINRLFKTNDTASSRIHKDDENLLQVILQTPFRGEVSDFEKNGIKLYVENYENGVISLVLSPGGIEQNELENAANALKKSINI